MSEQRHQRLQRHPGIDQRRGEGYLYFFCKNAGHRRFRVLGT